ncbi:MAG: NADPH-dependent oxidoreductase [Anaerolineales bacterium]|jgi:FMN reductase (NADPH)
MENPTIDLIHHHTSVRHYKPDPLPSSMVETIISAAQCASTSSNLQAYSVVAVTGLEMRTRFSKLCGNQAHIREAPVLLVWCADLARLDRVCKLRGYTQVTEFTENFLIAAVDTSLAAQNAALAAESLGLGICYIGSIRNNSTATIELLNLPKLTFPVTGMTLGWPEQQQNIRPRLPLHSVLHWESYSDKTEEETLRAYDSTMIALGIYGGRQVPAPGKPDVMEDYGWTEHSARRVSVAARTDLRSALEKQGFCMK